jgi:hypothetical protein
MNRKNYIYGLSGNDGIIRYIGKSYDPNKRLKEHLFDSDKNIGNKHKNNWIKKLIKNNEQINVTILEECGEDNWVEREKFWIKNYTNLTNISEGGDGCSGFRYKKPLNEVILWVKQNLPHIKTESDWRIYIKHNTLPNFIPKRPDSRYKNDGWISFEHFLSYPSNKKFHMSYEDLKYNVRKNDIKTSTEYRKNRTPDMPYSPEVYYKQEWISWKNFLGYDKKIGRNIVRPIKEKKEPIVNFNVAKEIIKKFNLTKKVDYDKWYVNNKHLRLPSNPRIFYQKNWISWKDFFGNDLPKIIHYNKKEKNNNFLNYSETKIWVSTNLPNIKIEKEWRQNTKNLPYFIPKRPDYRYKNEGWLGWKEFLN